ncbi:hypothetical protein MTR67_016088 [Solanum verrucosum]|uniref:Uncharacterized protein n=1 Tax=Solanum verrucosum TaxID=315347 RepID=A0AAF0TQ31_SOLVR|nr:hypothetical protein MTR67_016088 [Solanum verrucosum]
MQTTLGIESKKKEKLWIIWVHTCNIKSQNWLTIDLPKQAAWMIKKILQMRKHWQQLGDMRSLIVKGKFHLATAYKCLWGETPKDGRNGKEESKNEAQNGIGNNNTPEMCPQVHLLLLVSSYKLPSAQSASKPVVSTVSAKQLQLLTPNSQTKLMTSSDDQPLWKKELVAQIANKNHVQRCWTDLLWKIFINLRGIAGLCREEYLRKTSIANELKMKKMPYIVLVMAGSSFVASGKLIQASIGSVWGF